MNTKDFKTKTVFKKVDNPVADGFWTVAMDIGYSAVKGVSNNSVFCFPSFAKKTDTKTAIIGTPSVYDIQYKDENGELWDVGAVAVSMVSQYDTQDSEEVLYTRNRYHSPMFLVIARVGLALGMRVMKDSSPIGKTLVLQTGLPPAFLKTDTPVLKKVLSGRHKFSVRLGSSDWIDYDFELPADNIYIMAQPLGTLFGVTLDDDANLTPNAAEYLNSGVLVCDGGFGTLDTFEIRNKRVTSSQTFNNLGMRAVFRLVADRLFDDYGVEVGVQAMQVPLECGYVKQFNADEMKTQRIEIDEYLVKASEDICKEAIMKIRTVYNNLLEFRYLLITGGTGEAWFKIIKKYFSGMEGLSVICGSENTNLPTIFANVRGYYLYRVSSLRRLASKR